MSLRRTLPAVVPSLLLFGLLASPALAGTLKVPKDHPTIQAAVDAAAPGDTVQVAGGTYLENVVVPEDKQGLLLEGKGKVFVDGLTGGPGLVVKADDVTVRGLTLRHAQAEGVVVSEGGEGFSQQGVRLEGLVVLGAADLGLRAACNGLVVEGCTFDGNAGGLFSSGSGVTFRRTIVRATAGDALLAAADSLVSRCTFERIVEGRGIVLDGGSGAVVERCTLQEVDGDAIAISAAEVTVSRCRIEDVGGVGIRVDGADARVEKNVLSGLADEGLRIAGAGAQVLKNEVSCGTARAVGIRVDAPSGALVSRNTVSAFQGSGFLLTIDGGRVERNRASSCGSESGALPGDAGFFVLGDGNTLEKNTARACHRSGFVLAGSDNRLDGDKALDNTDNGFLVETTAKGDGHVDNELRAVSAKGNQGEGLENRGSGTRLVGATLKGNRLDLAGGAVDGTLLDGGGNVFKTGGFDAPAQVP